MRRREFIALVGYVAMVWPLVASAAGAMPRMSVLVGLPEGDPSAQQWKAILLQSLSALGWKPDVNIRIDWRWATADLDRTQKLAKELVELRPDILVVTNTPSTAAILRETHTIPVVFSLVSDPVGSGFVQSLRQPGSNATGFINIEGSVGGKWLELLKEIAPSTSQVLFLFNPKTAPQSYYYLKVVQAAAAPSGLTLAVAEISSVAEIEAAITGLAQKPNAGLVVPPDIFTSQRERRDLIVSLAARLRIPAVYAVSDFVEGGGLISYGPDRADLLRKAAGYADRILKGEKPQDLPVQLPTKFELAINTKTAAALGLTIPQTLLVAADEVID
jgi:putative ABC transport system substrate-binding protein